MGKGISYCRSCGIRLASDASFAASDGRNYCDPCRPADVAAPLERRKAATTKIRAQSTAARPRETTRLRRRGGWGAALAAAGVVALAVGLAIAAASSAEAPRAPAPPPRAAAVVDAPPPVKAESAPTLDELLARIRDLRQNDLMFERRDEVLKLLSEAAGRAGARLGEVDWIAVEYDRKYEDAAARLADFTRSEAQRLASKEKFAEAVERLDGYPAPFRASRSAAALRELRQEYVRRRGDAVPASVGAPPSKRVF